MKNKIKLYGVSALAVAGAMAFGATSDTFAAETTISIETVTSGTSSICRVSGAGSGTTCPSSYGTFDSSTNTFTFGTGLNSLNANVDFDSSSELTLKASGDVTTSIYASSSTPIVFDFNNYKFTEKEFTNSSGMEVDSYISGTSLTMESGTLNIDSIGSSTTDITINGGAVNLSKIVTTTTGVFADDFTMTGGSLNINSDDSSSSFSVGTFTMSGGTITAAMSSSGIMFDDDFTFSGGTLGITSRATSTYSGISGNSGAPMTISGGSITIDGFDVGLFSEDKIYFNGGTTTIKNAPTNAVAVHYSTDPINAMNFATNMGIKEGKVVYYSNDTGTSTIAGGDVTTITSGYSVTKVSGQVIDDGDDGGESGITVPDTGEVSNQEHSSVVQLSIMALTGVTVIGFMARCLKGYVSRRVHFSKK